MSNTIERLKKYIDAKGISIRKFESSIGFSNGAFATQYKNKKTIGVDKIEKVLEMYPDLNPLWLISGKGDMLLQSESEDNCFRSTEERLSDSDLIYTEQEISYKDKYIIELEKKNAFLEEENRIKQELIEAFMSGKIIKS